MIISSSLKDFKKKHLSKINQTIYFSEKFKNKFIIERLIDNFLNEKNSFVFESVEKGKIRGRFTIFGKNPDKIWELNNEKVISIINDKKKKLKIKPYVFLNKLIENFNFVTPKNLPPICSLLSGFFSYDIIRYIENIPNSCNDDLKLPDVRLMRPRSVIIHDNLKKKIHFIVNCYSDEKINNYKNKFDLIRNDLINLKKITSDKNLYIKKKIYRKKISKIKSNMSKKYFKSMVLNAKKQIKIGNIFQVVLSQRFQTQLTKSPLEIYKKLRITNPSPFMYFFNFSDFQIIGASPEILVRLRNNKVTVRPIAGTRPRGKNKKMDKFYKKDLLKDKKELAEHLMLLDLGRNDVGKVAKINSVKVTENFKIEKYSHVMHIVSNVEGTFNKKNSKIDTLLSGFPAGTVSGAPKIKAMEIIDSLEKTKRKIYAGGIGYFSANGDFDTCIALRTALAKENKFYVQAGAGIVADSKPENEYRETVNKAKALINALR
jgi:anthranilate synthase component 1|tara:strand:- start:125 stop:1588 length:1464 start_codon:yes stop_codon:yes gene_type:complete